MMKMLESKDSKPEPEVEDKLWLVAELVSLLEEISSRPTEVVELFIETLVDLSAEPIMELVPSLTLIRASIFLKLPDVYDPLQILL